MQARGPLMIEHRLIERLLVLIKDALEKAESSGKIDPLFVDTAVDFVRTYADRTPRKEEDSFSELNSAPCQPMTGGS